MRLARLLKPLGVHSHTLWRSGNAAKGYRSNDFQDAFHRYLPAEVVRSLEPLNHAENSEVEVVRQDEPLTTSEGEFVVQQSQPNDLTTLLGGDGGETQTGSSRRPLIGDPGFLEHLFAAFEAGHVTKLERKQAEKAHCFVVDSEFP
jgi:hypothetical protein